MSSTRLGKVFCINLYCQNINWEEYKDECFPTKDIFNCPNWKYLADTLATTEEKIDAKGKAVSKMPFNDKFSLVFITKAETLDEFNAVCKNIPNSANMNKITVTK